MSSYSKYLVKKMLQPSHQQCMLHCFAYAQSIINNLLITGSFANLLITGLGPKAWTQGPGPGPARGGMGHYACECPLHKYIGGGNGGSLLGRSMG